MSQWWLPNCFGQWLPQILSRPVTYLSVSISLEAVKKHRLWVRGIWGSILWIKPRKRKLGGCRRALECELVYGTMKSCSEAAKAAQGAPCSQGILGGGVSRRAHRLGREIVAVVAGGNKGRSCCFGTVGELHLYSCNFSCW